MIRAILFNWEFKLIALMLAISLYFYTSDLINIDRRLVIPVLHQVKNIDNVPDGYVVTGLDPLSEIEVFIRGPRKIVQNLEENLNVTLNLEKKSIREGEQIFAINNKLLGLDPKIKIEEIRPVRQIVVAVSKQLYRSVPIDANIRFLELPETVQQPEVQLEKTDLGVHGPEAEVEGLTSLEVEPIKISIPKEHIGAFEKVVPIRILLPPSVRVTDAASLYAKITIKPKMAKREMNLPISILADPEFMSQYRVKFNSPVITVTVSGPVSYLGELKEDQLTAYVILSAEQFLETAVKSLTVYVKSPSWTNVKSGQMQVSARKRTHVNDDMPDPPVIDQEDLNDNPVETPIIESGGNEPIIPSSEFKKKSILPGD